MKAHLVQRDLAVVFALATQLGLRLLHSGTQVNNGAQLRLLIAREHRGVADAVQIPGDRIRR